MNIGTNLYVCPTFVRTRGCGRATLGFTAYAYQHGYISTSVIARYGSKRTDGRHPFLNGKKCVLSKHNCRLNTSWLMRLAALCCSGHPSGHGLMVERTSKAKVKPSHLVNMGRDPPGINLPVGCNSFVYGGKKDGRCGKGVPPEYSNFPPHPALTRLQTAPRLGHHG
jgi:hypothetical protein